MYTVKVAAMLCVYKIHMLQAQKKTEGSVYDSPRAMAKLLKEAQRVKQVLSANSEHFAQVHGILCRSCALSRDYSLCRVICHGIHID